MSANPNPVTAGKTVRSILQVLSDVNAEVALGVQIGTVLYPFAKGAIAAIKNKVSGTIDQTFEVTVTLTEAQLDAVVNVEEADLAEDDAELIRLGLRTVPGPAAPPTQPPVQK